MHNTTIRLTDSYGQTREVQAGDIVGVTPTTTSGCGKFPNRVEATRVLTTQGKLKAMNEFEVVQNTWLGALRGSESEVTLEPTTMPPMAEVVAEPEDEDDFLG